MSVTEKNIKKISFYTLGCRLNQSETAVISNSFKADGFNVVEFDKPADVAVINTCTVTENGDADTRRLVNKVSRLNPDVQIALVGCQAQVQKEKLLELKNVRWVVGNEKKMDLTSIIKKIDEDTTPKVITPVISREPFTIPIAGIDPKHTRANIKIQDGCDFFCSFCEIPYARGRARSRLFEDIILEANALVAAGHKELVITGINVGTYQEGGKTILDVVDALENVEGLKRIRISSIEPTTISKTLINKMKSDSKLCRYLHIPLQSGNDQMLEEMKRKYSFNEFYEFISDVYNTVSDVCIGTDVIVGFPGETEEQFEETVTRLRESPIHYFHVFSYSERYLAKSKTLNKKTPISMIQERSKVLRDLSQRKKRVFYQQQIGKELDVLFEQKKNGYWHGLTDNYLRVKVRTNEDLSNQIRKVHLCEVSEQTILSTLI